MIKIDMNSLKTDKIHRVYKTYIIPSVYAKIVEELNKESDSPLNEAHKIAIAFLKRHFVDENGAPSESKISLYLFDETQADPQKELDAIILSYWQSLVEVWSAQTGNPNLNDNDIVLLSRWELLKKQALIESDPEKRLKIVTSVINKDTLSLFSNVTHNHLSAWYRKGQVSNYRLEQITITHHKEALEILSGIFDYSEFMNNPEVSPTPRHQLLSAMRIPVCPYCNRQYITIYTDTDGHAVSTTSSEKTTADLDHYYIKSSYPYLSLSLFNFIPSCQICNSRFKGTTDFYLEPHVYPYSQEFGDDVTFKINSLSALIDEEIDWDDPEILVLDDKSGKDSVNSAIKTFHLSEVYRSHIDYVHELWWKTQMYNTDMIDTLRDEYSKLFVTERSLMDLIFGQYLDKADMHKRPLAKLTRDILKEHYAELID